MVSAVPGADAPVANLRITMQTNVNPQALALWDIANRAMDAKGDLAGSKIPSDNWATLLKIGKDLEEGGRTLATSNGAVAAPPGAKLQDEGNFGASTAVDVQRFIDAKSAEFRGHGLDLQKTGAGLVKAVGTHDAKRLSALAGSLDEVRESSVES